MFKSEQHIARNVASSTKNAVLNHGIPLAGNIAVSRGIFSYRVLTLALGIIVALIIAFTILAAHLSVAGEESSHQKPAVIVPLLKEVVEKASWTMEVFQPGGF